MITEHNKEQAIIMLTLKYGSLDAAVFKTWSVSLTEVEKIVIREEIQRWIVAECGD
jgi:hypothetical protein